jgi:hypothetical protein
VVEYVDGRRVSDVEVVVDVAGNATYRTRVDRQGIVHLAHDRPPVTTDRLYADGRTRYELDPAPNATPRVRRSAADPSVDRFAAEAATLVSWYLSANETAVSDALARADGGRVYSVRAGGEESATVANVTTTAVVDDTGVVRRLYRRHEVTGTGVVVVVRFAYLSLGDATVSRPAWLDDGDVEWAGVPGNRTTARDRTG